MNIDCPLCGHIRRRNMALPSAILDLPEDHATRVVACADCGLYYLWPGVPEGDVSSLYGASYFLGTQSQSNNFSELPATGSDYASDIVPTRIEKFHDTVKLLQALSPNARNILDIGAATGDFLAIARDEGLAVTGIEISNYASLVARERHGFEFFVSGILECPITEKFDLIHMNHVFEHFSKPNQVLCKIKSILNEGGLIYVEVPFQFNMIERLMYHFFNKKKKFDVYSLHHPIFYKPSTLEKVFSKHGFRLKTMSLFKWSRYHAVGVSGLVKKILWAVASLFGQGIYIEAVFEKEDT